MSHKKRNATGGTIPMATQENRKAIESITPNYTHIACNNQIYRRQSDLDRLIRFARAHLEVGPSEKHRRILGALLTLRLRRQGGSNG